MSALFRVELTLLRLNFDVDEYEYLQLNTDQTYSQTFKCAKLLKLSLK